MQVPWQNSYLEEDFIDSPANFVAKKWLDQWPNWQSGIYPKISFLYGPAECGKTHLAKIWQHKSLAKEISFKDIEHFNYHGEEDAFLLEDIELYKGKESSLLLFLNYIIEQGKFLLITANTKAQLLPFSLPDLNSRLRSFYPLEILKPDLENVEQLLVKLFSDLQISISHEVSKFLATRIDASYTQIKKTVEAINYLSLSNNRKITINLVKELLTTNI